MKPFSLQLVFFMVGCAVQVADKASECEPFCDEENIIESNGITLFPDREAPPVTATPGTALHHAQVCSQYLGPIPAMSCADALPIPITVDGIAVEGWPETCDKPSALGASCQPAQVGRYSGTYHDGRPRPEVDFLIFCRDGGMGVIGHNSESGATCFFHMEPVRANTEIHVGSDHPDYEDYWQDPAIVASDNCQGCHQADPWLHSPWIDQVMNPEKPTETLVPITASAGSSYVIVGENFRQPQHLDAPQNTCTSCHKPQCDSLFSIPLGLLQMPAPFHSMEESVFSQTDYEELQHWCWEQDLLGAQ